MNLSELANELLGSDNPLAEAAGEAVDEYESLVEDILAGAKFKDLYRQAREAKEKKR